jgi:hypothetical protein
MSSLIIETIFLVSCRSNGVKYAGPISRQWVHTELILLDDSPLSVHITFLSLDMSIREPKPTILTNRIPKAKLAMNDNKTIS